MILPAYQYSQREKNIVLLYCQMANYLLSEVKQATLKLRG